MNQFSILMKLLNHGWTTTPDPALISQHRSSVPVDDRAYIKPLTHGPSSYYYLPSKSSNGLPDDPYLGHVDVGPINATTGFSDVEAPALYHPHNYQGHLEGVGLASSPSHFRPAFDGRDPLPTSTHTSDLLHSPSLHQDSEHDRLFSQTPPTPSAEINVNTNTPCELAPLQDDYPSIPTGAISWMRPYRNESSDFDAFFSTTVTHGSMRDSRAATTSLGTRSIYSTPSSQPPVTSTNSAIHPNRPSNHYSSLEPYSDHGDRPAPSDFRSARQGHTAAGSLIASSKVSAVRRKPKKYWCKVPACIAGFSQKQGLQRHSKDVHGSRHLCPYCKDFEWSPGRKYALRKHLEAKHSGVALPKMALRLQRQDPRGSRRA